MNNINKNQAIILGTRTRPDLIEFETRQRFSAFFNILSALSKSFSNLICITGLIAIFKI